MERLRAALERPGPKLSAYLAVGHPDLETARRNMDAAITAGAAWLEVGFPFSDPAADGPVIQAATHAALLAGTRVQDDFDTVHALRQDHPDTPLVVMTYANLAHAMGWDTFAARLAEAGADGLILPDVPLEEAGPVREALAAHGLAWVPLVTPTTPADRMAAIAATATGFLYVVGNVGTTGQADPGPLVEATVARARSVSDVPIAVGFGIASAADVARVHAAGADAAIVGSHLVRIAPQGPSAVAAAVQELLGGA